MDIAANSFFNGQTQLFAAQSAALQGKVNQLKADATAQAGSSQPMTEKQQALWKSCQDFEGIFIQYLLEQMRKAGPQDTFLDKGLGHDIFVSMYDQELSKSMAKAGQFGIAKMVYNQLSKQLS